MVKKTILLVSDFEIGKDGNGQTGYTNIATTIGNALNRIYNVVAFGVSYNRNQHNNTFGICQIPIKSILSGINSLQLAVNVDHCLIIMDIPFIESVMPHVRLEKSKTKFSGIFAVEGDPITFKWAMALGKLDGKFPISQFGERECQTAGLADARYLPITVNNFRQRTTEEHLLIKETLGLKDKTVLFYNADNNERKNISALLEAMQLLPDKYFLQLLTRKTSPVGWSIDDLVAELGLQSRVNSIERGLPLEELWKLYAGADFYVHPAKAEGYGFPIVEAMAVGLPVIAGNNTAMAEHIADGRGVVLPTDYVHRDVFGNTSRYYIYPQTIAKVIQETDQIPYPSFDNMIVSARNYVDQHTVDRMIEPLVEFIGDNESEQTQALQEPDQEVAVTSSAFEWQEAAVK
jgi:glycosyltransferase involved in cell wall biosynthesis